MPSGPVTVIGATGRQGGAVVEAPVDRAVPVRAATRNSNGDKGLG
ncbi:NmrA family NAD(P)-binding protein [Mycobacterium sp. IEC1808]|nr:NmrA family NAD(P)-binding protein [Mycobacterium sp. IEC1808]